MSKRKRRTEKFKKNKPRRCHDCGRPTTNYRCDECWKKLRRKGGYIPAGEAVDLGCEVVWRKIYGDRL